MTGGGGKGGGMFRWEVEFMWSIPIVAAIAISAAIVITLYQNAQQRARLAADQGTIAAMRSAIAQYYRDHGAFPARPPAARPFECVKLKYAYSPSTGELRITSTNGVEDCL